MSKISILYIIESLAKTNINLVKLFLPNNTVDFVKQHDSGLVSIIDGTKYLTNYEVSGVDFFINKDELKLIKKLKIKENTVTPDSDFIIARAFNIDPRLIKKENEELIISLYRTKLINFVKQHLGNTPSNYNIHDLDALMEINDNSVLLQYFNRDAFFYDTSFKHNNILKYLDILRQRIYAILYKDKKPFESIFDNELRWVNACKSLFNIPNIIFADFNTSESENKELVNKIKDIWQKEIYKTYEKANLFLLEERKSSVEFNDQDTLKEIDIILEDLKRCLEEAKTTVLSKKTIREILRYWPELLIPAPSQYCN